MDTRTNYDATTTPDNTKMIVGIVAAVAVVLLAWAFFAQKTPVVDTRDQMNAPVTAPTTR